MISHARATTTLMLTWRQCTKQRGGGIKELALLPSSPNMVTVRDGEVHLIYMPPNLMWHHMPPYATQATWLPCLSNSVVEITWRGAREERP